VETMSKGILGTCHAIVRLVVASITMMLILSENLIMVIMMILLRYLLLSI
jgi:hypothetical protein